MSTAEPQSLTQAEYADAAEAYLRSLPPEHFMEATAQATQRKITVCSFALIAADNPEIQLFNELLVQYPVPGRSRPGQVVPDNMMVVCEQEIEAGGSYDLPFQPVRPFWMMEYVSASSRRKDYEDSFKKYELDLQVPYYLLFYPDGLEITLYRHDGMKYRTVTPNEHGRYPVPEVKVELALLGGWVRYWYKGDLVPLPGDLKRLLDESERRAAEDRRGREEAERAAAEDRRVREQAERATVEERQHREEAERATLEERQHRENAERAAAEEKRVRENAERAAVEERQHREQAERAAAEERQHREKAERAATGHKRGREDAERQAAEERQARLALEQRLAQLQVLLGAAPPEQKPDA